MTCRATHILSATKMYYIGLEPLHSAMPLPTYLFVVRKNRKTGRCETRQINIFAHSIGADFLEATSNGCKRAHWVSCIYMKNPALKTQILLTHCPIYIASLQLKSVTELAKKLAHICQKCTKLHIFHVKIYFCSGGA